MGEVDLATLAEQYVIGDVTLSDLQARVSQEDFLNIFELVKAMAVTDELTHLPNRRHFRGILKRRLLHLRGKKRASLALLLVDIDLFKIVNDTHGHPVGDVVLRSVARAIKGCIRNTDYVARVGGEEFVVILGGGSKKVHESRSQSICDSVARLPIEVGDSYIQVTVSVGLASTQVVGLDSELLIRAADSSLYQAKNDGRNRSVAYKIVR